MTPLRFVATLLLSLLPLGQAASQVPVTPQSWQELERLAEVLYEKGEIEAAIAASRRALSAAVTTEQRGHSLTTLGKLLHEAGKSAEAERYLRESLALRRDAFGEDSQDYAHAAHELAVLTRDTGRYDEALSLATRAATTRRRLPATDVRIPQAINTLGTVVALRGDYLGAIALFEEAVAMHEAGSPAAAAAEYGVVCVNLAGTYQRLGRYQLAEMTMAKGREFLMIRPGPNHPAYILSTLALAALKSDMADYAEAGPLFDEGVRLMTAPRQTRATTCRLRSITAAYVPQSRQPRPRRTGLDTFSRPQAGSRATGASIQRCHDTGQSRPAHLST